MNESKSETINVATLPPNLCLEIEDPIAKEICLANFSITVHEQKLSNPELSERQRKVTENVIRFAKENLQYYENMTEDEKELFRSNYEKNKDLLKELPEKN
jgi:hypothetical protein